MNSATPAASSRDAAAWVTGTDCRYDGGSPHEEHGTHPSGTARFLCALALAATVSTAAVGDAGLEVAPADTLRNALGKQQGKAVKLRLRGGDELDGKAVRVGDAIVRLGELAGREFHDAVVDLSSIQAVVRAR